jgi:hypothetical protein
MKRRTFLPAAAAAGAALGGNAGAAPAKPAIIELQRYQLRNGADNQNQRINEYLGQIWLPAVQRGGAAVTGCFGSVIAENTPFAIAVASYPSLAAMEAVQEKMAADEEYRAAATSFFHAPGLAFERLETSLLRAFAGMPSIEVPSMEGRQSPRIFELRTYESNDPATLARKIRMFEEGEIGIFRRTGLQPVFFGSTIAGGRMPNLTYMLAFEDLTARDKNWRAFVGDPAWDKLRKQPGYADGEIVSNISNSILRPLPFSQIR